MAYFLRSLLVCLSRKGLVRSYLKSSRIHAIDSDRAMADVLGSIARVN